MTNLKKILMKFEKRFQDIDEVSISYKLHYQQYSIVNDFFVFRVVSPAVSSPLLRFDVSKKKLQ